MNQRKLKYYVGMLRHIATASRDTSTKVGALVVGPAGEIRSTGYNDFPRGINDDAEGRRDRPLKYEFTEHCLGWTYNWHCVIYRYMNAIYQDRQWLYTQRVELDRSTADIAAECGVDTCTVTKWYNRLGVPNPIKRREFILVCSECTRPYTSKGRKRTKDGVFKCRRCQSRERNAKPHNKAIQRAFNESEQGRRSRRAWALRRYYGMSLGDYDTLLEKQHGACAICDSPNREGHSLVVDHNHHTGKIRGLLCHRCNMALGMFDDLESRLISALVYLREHDG